MSGEEDDENDRCDKEFSSVLDLGDELEVEQLDIELGDFPPDEHYS